MKEKIKRIKDLCSKIEERYYSYAWSGGVPNWDEEVESWIKERDQILDELSKEE